MKNLFIVIVALLLVSALVFGQKQPLPTQNGGVQATRAAMLKGPHDFTPDSGAYTLEVLTGGAWDGTDSTVIHPHGPATGLCGYCHAPHVPPEGIAAPLWIRATEVTTYGPVYSNPISLDATVLDPGADDNYSAFCLGCHDGSALFVASAYAGSRPYAGYPPPDWTPYEGFTVRHEAEISPTGEFPLDHVHPVNFDYNTAVTLDPQGLYAANDAVSHVWKGTYNGQQTTVRLFDGYMQCSTCHNPHMSSGIGLVYSSAYGKLCVACHKK